jgi:hypothetical protein
MRGKMARKPCCRASNGGAAGMVEAVRTVHGTTSEGGRPLRRGGPLQEQGTTAGALPGGGDGQKLAASPPNNASFKGLFKPGEAAQVRRQAGAGQPPEGAEFGQGPAGAAWPDNLSGDPDGSGWIVLNWDRDGERCAGRAEQVQVDGPHRRPGLYIIYWSAGGAGLRRFLAAGSANRLGATALAEPAPADRGGLGPHRGRGQDRPHRQPGGSLDVAKRGSDEPYA